MIAFSLSRETTRIEGSFPGGIFYSRPLSTKWKGLE
jgi:hypothetical protein